MSDLRKADDAQNLLVVLGDQLTPTLPAFRAVEPARTVVLLAEVAEEAGYVPHHKKKIAFVFSAMRHFAMELRAAGWTVDYIRLDDAHNTGSIAGEISRAVARHGCAAVTLTEPGEWRLAAALASLETDLGIPVEICSDDRFLCSRSAFADWAGGRKQLRMEHFYRWMRQQTGLLMDGDAPAGGRWNYDSENRKPPRNDMRFPVLRRFAPDVTSREVLALVTHHFADNFGVLDPFGFAVTREHAEIVFEAFLTEALPDFGSYQDAMLAGEPFLYHSAIALYLNVGLLDPLSVCRRAEAEWRKGAVPINSAEGFIRQIIGWREYVRGIYWLTMPGYVERNHLAHQRPLPDFYWTGETEMACIRACVEQTRDEAYAHHIQRLMVTGNFAMLAGVDPKAVHEWYLAVYADAYEWVELPNTLGMSQFADGGLLASKPYAASGNYINRMSDYCSDCRFKVSKKTGPDACPFNYLYWDFIDRHRERLARNPRLGPVYRNLDRMSPDRRQAFRDDAKRFLNRLDNQQLPSGAIPQADTPACSQDTGGRRSA